MMQNKAALESFALPVNLKLALLWAALMFLYVYNDYFSLYEPGTIPAMMAGSLGPLGKATGAAFRNRKCCRTVGHSAATML